eukprot:TRINITY_DN12556_c0_g1_i1.p1 TRINITY_DN12556_c0_g1~~TRINITY_DN12556_c0_g1_i1.p1  ORF type:complete len:205 (+),score=69.91 TRINITY_DN12556_c0_g1_i1:443-1057(+)
MPGGLRCETTSVLKHPHTLSPGEGARMGSYTFPDVYSFPPLFTLQRAPETREKQCEMWHSIVTGYCGSRKQYEISTGDGVFSNDTISRRLDADSARVILGSLVSTGKAVWQKNPATGQATDTCYIAPRPLLEYANELYQKVDDEGQVGSVMTLYELTQDQAQGTSWEGMPEGLMRCVLDVLQKQGRAEVIDMGGDDGVKFLQVQ